MEMAAAAAAAATSAATQSQQESRASRHAQAVVRLLRRSSPDSTRPLTRAEVAALTAAGNECLPGSEWKDVRVIESADRATPGATFDPRAVRGCRFGGNVLLGAVHRLRTCDVAGQPLPSGLYNSTLVNSTFLDGCLVSNTTLVAGVVLGEGACIVGCTCVCQSRDEGAPRGGFATRSFGNGQQLPIAVEVGGRETAIYAELSLEQAAAVAGDRSDEVRVQAHESYAAEYARAVASDRTLIDRGASVVGCARLENVYVGPGALIEAAYVTDSTVLSAAGPHGRTSIRSGAHVENSIVQWGCSCESMAIVTGSLLCSTSHVERHGKVIDSIIGPCTGVAEGEVTSSLVGPFVGFHHQALLIATYWPAGRGNIGYGANVGSNHTGKAPDQELWPGEGVFFGLATAIKFPANYTRAAYSLIATGVTTLPQVVEMPFSLINSPGQSISGLSPAINEIMPGWILSDNMYMLLRSEAKFLKRGRKVAQLGDDASPHGLYNNEVLRPDTVTMMLEARERLRSTGPDVARLKDARGKPIYTSKEIAGLGKNYMTERSRQRGVDAYSNFILFYATRALYRAMRSGVHAAEWFPVRSSVDGVGVAAPLDLTSTQPSLPTDADRTREWFEFAGPLLQAEMGADVNPDAALCKYVELLEMTVSSVLASKQKDDKRGPRVIEGYAAAHAPAEEDKVVVAVAQELEEVRKSVAAVRSRL